MPRDVMINGYVDGFVPPLGVSPLVDGYELVRDPCFWPAYFCTVGVDEATHPAFAVDAAALNAMLEKISDSQRWPVLWLPLQFNTGLWIVQRNFDEDGGVDFLLDRGREQRYLDLAAIEGHYRGPALSWTELISTSRLPDDRLSPAERLLLLLPACGDADIPPDAGQIVSNALVAVGAVGDVSDLTADLLDGPFWDSPIWTIEDGVRTCSGTYAYRQSGAMTPDDLAFVTRVLSAGTDRDGAPS